MEATIYINGVIGQDTVLLDVIRQFKSFKKPTAVTVVIDSVGGCVDTGMSIYNYLRNLQLPITTVATKAYSIAASIFMAGDERLIAENGDMMIHFPWVDGFSGGADALEGVAKELRAIENDFVDFYSIYTDIDKASIKKLLQNETFLDGSEAMNLGFSTGIKQQLKAVALYNNKEKEEENNMTKSQKFIKVLNEFFSDKIEINALEVADANGDIINFPDLETDELPVVKTDEMEGSKAVDADGKPIEGERISTDGSVWVFIAGELIEIKEAVTEEDTVEEEVVTEDAVAEASENEDEVEDEIDFKAILKMFAELKDSTKTQSEMIENQNNEIIALKKQIGSEEATVNAMNLNNNTKLKSDLPANILGLINSRK
ncbi:Clp protease ClpP [Leeuwenhoekiella sp. NPDC079379]|uniref:Clp protease ClpP n=1 Tax=Leeuwenhoekiella sp. NPDC079379 TaxID=3364122 RepID=UPI0037C93D00